MMKLLILAFLFAVAFAVPLTAQFASQPPGQLEVRVSSLESKVAQFPSEGLVLFLFGAFCALWAMNTGRSSWLWFFLGLFFSVIAVLVLLNKNAEDRRRSDKKPFDLRDYLS